MQAVVQPLPEVHELVQFQEGPELVGERQVVRTLRGKGQMMLDDRVFRGRNTYVFVIRREELQGDIEQTRAQRKQSCGWQSCAMYVA